MLSNTVNKYKCNIYRNNLIQWIPMVQHSYDIVGFILSWLRLNQDLRHETAGRKHNRNETVQNGWPVHKCWRAVLLDLRSGGYLIDVKLSTRFRCNTFCGTTNLLETKWNETRRAKRFWMRKINVIITAILSYLFCVCLRRLPSRAIQGSLHSHIKM